MLHKLVFSKVFFIRFIKFTLTLLHNYFSPLSEQFIIKIPQKTKITFTFTAGGNLSALKSKELDLFRYEGHAHAHLTPRIVSRIAVSLGQQFSEEKLEVNNLFNVLLLQEKISRV